MNRSKTNSANNRDQRKKQNSSKQKKNRKKYESNADESAELLTDESDSSTEMDKLGGNEENHVKPMVISYSKIR